MKLWTLLTRSLLSLALLSAAAAAQPPAEPSEPQRERLRQAVQTLLISLAQDPSFQAMADGDWNLIYSQDSQEFTNFGAIFGSGFDEQIDARGLLALAVTPNSTAAEMGIRSGDRIRGLNGLTLVGLGAAADGQARAYTEFAALLKAIPDGGPVAVELERNGRFVELNGTLERWRLPAVSLALTVPGGISASAGEGATEQPGEAAPPPDRDACGTLSLHHSPPHRYDLYPAYLTAINRDGGATVMRRFHYLKPGTYTLTLNDVIPARELRLKHTRFEDRREAKQLDLEVEDGMVYHLGARLLYDRKQQRNHSDYWKPVVWRMEPGYCKGKPVAR